MKFNFLNDVPKNEIGQTFDHHQLVHQLDSILVTVDQIFVIDQLRDLNVIDLQNRGLVGVAKNGLLDLYVFQRRDVLHVAYNIL